MKWISIIGAVAVLLALGAVFFRPGKAHFGPLTNIDGIPYPVRDGRVVITEKLAHADMYVSGTLFARELTLKVVLVPLATDEVSVGVRENSFWLSYPRQSLYQATAGGIKPGESAIISRTITIPLTDKLPDRDGSLDLMFFAGKETLPAADPAQDETLWHLVSLQAEISHAWPSRAAIKDYLRRIATSETPV
jgi:hypothetical protein